MESKLPRLQYPYRNEQNQRYSKLLFVEQVREIPNDQKVWDPPFTLNARLEGYKCMREEYIRDADPTGYTTSTRLLGDFAYWKHLERAAWFREALAAWNEELDAKLQAEGLAKIREISLGDDAKALQAAKYLADKAYRKADSKRGRPSKEEVQGKLAEEANQTKAIEDDAARIRLIRG